MTSFAIDKKSHKDASKQSKIRNMTKSSNPNEVAVAKKKLKSKIELPPNPQIEGLKIVDLIVTEINNDVFEDHMHKSCGKGKYYCYTDKKCKKVPSGYHVGGRGRLVQDDDDQDENDTNGNGGNGDGGDGGGMGENVILRTCTGEKFAEIIDLIRPEDVMPKMKAADQWVNEEDTYNQAKKELKATKKARDQRHKSVHSPTDTKGNVDVNESLDDKRRANVEKQKANVASTTQKSQASQSAVRGVFAKAAAAKAKSKAKQKERNDISKEIQSTIKNQSEELQMTVDEAVRLPSEFGHIVMVGVQWRGKMYNIRMFFPQAKMPSRGDVQDEIIKVYPGGKVVYFQRDELPSNEAQFDNDRNPLIKVTKESAEVEEACKPKYDNTKSPDYEKKKKALAKKHGGEENIKGHPQYENRFASHTAGMSDAQKDMASSQVSKGFAYRHGRRLDKANFGDRKKAGKRGNPAQYRKSADSPENELRYPYGKSNIRQGKGSIKDLNKVKKEELLKSLRGFMDEGKIADAMRANLEKLRASDEKSQKNLEKFLKGTKQVRDDEKKAQDNA
tara:strand:+ start:6453 stop:8132 length:1680 start_codon:yes stop_codon:yes gene_type:complete